MSDESKSPEAEANAATAAREAHAALIVAQAQTEVNAHAAVSTVQAEVDAHPGTLHTSNGYGYWERALVEVAGGSDTRQRIYRPVFSPKLPP